MPAVTLPLGGNLTAGSEAQCVERTDAIASSTLAGGSAPSRRLPVLPVLSRIRAGSAVSLV